ncbi:MAG: LapA family protein [Gammaproteobacteria bacterium]|nr:MAG: LapA family protein [Gammaproteobacteria bacterium]
MARIALLFYLVALFLVAALGLAFAVYNAQTVHLDYVLGAVDLPLSVALLGALTAGVALGILACLGRILHLRHEIARLHRRHQLAEQEISNLRTLPIRD